MIKAYLAWIPSYYEGEDIEIRYVVYEDEELIEEESKFEDYCKPAICGLISLGELLESLEDYKDEEIQIIINDGAIYELLEGTSMTDKQDVLHMADKIINEINKFSDLEIKNVSGDHVEIEKWDEILTF